MKIDMIKFIFFLLFYKWVYERVMKLIFGLLIWNELCFFEVVKFDFLLF